MKKTSLFTIALVVSAMSLFAACGGGSSENTENADTTTYQDTSTMTAPVDTSHATDTSSVTDTTKKAP